MNDDKQYPFLDFFGQISYRQHGPTSIYLTENREENFFYVEIQGAPSIENFTLRELLSHDFIENLRKPDSEYLLIIHNIHEGFADIHIPTYERLVNTLGFHPRNILLIGGNHYLDQFIKSYAEEHGHELLRCEVYDVFENNVKTTLRSSPPERLEKFIQNDVLTPKNFTHTYLNFNRRWRPHRPIFVALLKCLNILDKGLVSLAPADCGKHGWDNFDSFANWFEKDAPEYKELLEENRDAIINLPHLYLDKPDLSINQAHVSPEDKLLYNRTMVSVVSETAFFNKSSDVIHGEPGVFLSEKIWKPILFSHPFIVISNHGILKVLQDKGYETFPEFIDESYDEEPNDVKRMIMILRELERICNWDDQTIEDFCKYARPIVARNRKRLMTGSLHPLKVLI